MSDIEYSQGIMTGAGAVVLKDGQPLTVDEIVSELNDLQAARTHPEQRSAGAVPEAIKAIADKLEQVEGKSAEGGYMWDARECAEFIREEADKLTAAPAASAVEGGGVAVHQFQPLSANGGWRDCGERDLKAFQQDGLYTTRTLYKHPRNGEQGGEWYCSSCGMEREPEQCNGGQTDNCRYVQRSAPPTEREE